MTRTTLAALLATCCLLTGCSEDEPASARDRGTSSDADFCALYVDQIRRQLELQSEDVEAKVEAAHAWAEEMRDAPLPEDIPAEARRGLDRMVDAFADLDVDMSAEELESLGDDFTGEARREVEAMGDYALETCASQVDDLMSEQLDGLQDELDGMTGSQ